MSAAERKKLIEWLAEVDEDQDVLDEFRRRGMEAAVNKAIDKGHDLSDDQKDFLIQNRNHPEKIAKKLEDESSQLESDSSVHQFWVLVRI